MPPLAQIQTRQVDLIALIMQSRSLNARLSKVQIDEYIEKVKKLPHDKQAEVYQILLEEQEKFADISNKMKASAMEYEKKLEEKKREIIKQMYSDAEKEERETADESISSLLHQLDD